MKDPPGALCPGTPTQGSTCVPISVLQFESYPLFVDFFVKMDPFFLKNANVLELTFTPLFWKTQSLRNEINGLYQVILLFKVLDMI